MVNEDKGTKKKGARNVIKFIHLHVFWIFNLFRKKMNCQMNM